MADRPETAWMRTMLKKYGSPEAVTEVMRQRGRAGGSTPPTKPRGFAANRERAARAGRISKPFSKRKVHASLEAQDEKH